MSHRRSVHDLKSLVLSFHSLMTVETVEEERVQALLREVVRNVVDSFSVRQRVRVELTREDAQRLVHALSGLTLAQARQVIAQTLVDDGRLTADDIQTVIRCKGEIIQRGGVLEFFPPE